jgi:hypothetical protein
MLGAPVWGGDPMMMSCVLTTLLPSSALITVVFATS